MNSDQLRTSLTPSEARLHFDIEFLAVGLKKREKKKRKDFHSQHESFKMKY